MKAILSRYRAFKRVPAYLEMFLEVGNARVSKQSQSFYKKMVQRKKIASQWFSISPNSMITFKFYVQTPFFSTFITLYLGTGHIQTLDRHSAPDGVCYGQFI